METWLLSVSPFFSYFPLSHRRTLFLITLTSSVCYVKHTHTHRKKHAQACVCTLTNNEQAWRMQKKVEGGREGPRLLLCTSAKQTDERWSGRQREREERCGGEEMYVFEEVGKKQRGERKGERRKEGEPRLLRGSW